MSKRKKNNQKNILPDSIELNPCPLCQIPLHFLRITGDMHLLRCEKNSWDQATECLDGIACFSSDFHHYWDYTHVTLAQYRGLNLNTPKNSEDEVKTSPMQKKKKSPKENTKAIPSNKSSSKSKRKLKVLSDCDSSTGESNDSDFILKTKECKKIPNKKINNKNTSRRSKSKKPRKRLVLSENENNSSDSEVLFLNTQTSSTKININTGYSSQNQEMNQSQIKEETENNKPIEEGFTHFLYSNSKEMFSNDESSNLPSKLFEEDTKSNDYQFHLGQGDQIIENNRLARTKSTTCLNEEFKKDEVFTSPIKCSSQDYDQFPTPNKYLTQEFKEIPDMSPQNYFEFELKEEAVSQTSHPEVAQAAQIQFSDSSDDDCEVNSETGEMLYTDKIEQDNESGKQRVQQEEPNIMLMEEDVKKVNKQDKSIEAWKKILNNRQQTTSKSKSNTKPMPQPQYNEPTEARYTSTDRAPFYKLIPDTDFVVDGFRNGPVVNKNNYFLSHFHYDHYIGLNKHFSKTIHCSTITRELLKSIIKIDAKYIRIIDIGQTKVINQVEVTALDANHCPGNANFKI